MIPDAYVAFLSGKTSGVRKVPETKQRRKAHPVSKVWKKSFKCSGCAVEFFGRPRQARALFCEPCHKVYRHVQRQAANAFQNAVRHGLVRSYVGQACADCGQPAQCQDHRSYLRPLDVVAVCYSCNSRRGPAEWKAK
jgi:hypothetical protein